MKKVILTPEKKQSFPFDWVKFDSDLCLRADGFKIEIYLKKDRVGIEDMKRLFYELFGCAKDELFVYSSSWWDFCIDTWNIQDNTFHYDDKSVSDETARYLSMLQYSCIEKGYCGCCKCNDWDVYLSRTLDCILKCIAPYGDFIYNPKRQYFFYFHHTGSIGLYYRNEDYFIQTLKANSKYKIVIPQI